MKCPMCGSLTANAHFCSDCGNQLLLLPSTIDFSKLIAERTHHFTGREWVFEAINDWLADANGSRYFLLTGEPGSGKSAIAARLSQFSQGSVDQPDTLSRLAPQFLSAIHFCSAGDRRWINPHVFAESLACQLSARYSAYAQALAQMSQAQKQIFLDVKQTARDVSGQMTGIIINKLDVSGLLPEDAFIRVVREPLEALCDEKPDKQVVILVDALDEALEYSGKVNIASLLTQTESLPANVRFLLSLRPGKHLTRHFMSQVQTFWLSANEQGQQDPRTIEDAKIYVVKLAKEQPVKEMLVKRKLLADTFAKQVASASKGNFLYLYHYAQGVRDGDQTLLDMEALPEGLYGIYEDFLAKIEQKRDNISWDEAYKPVLGTLAVAEEPLTRPQIANFAEVRQRTVGTILTRLKPFLDTVGQRKGKRYAIYHSSFGEYLISEENEDYIDGLEAHGLITDFYLSRFKNDWSQADEYGLLYLSSHLHTQKKKVSALRDLVESKAWNSAKYVDTPWVDSLVQDLQLVSMIDGGRGISDWVPSMGYQLRRALIEEHMSRISPKSILFFAKLGQVERALEFARRHWLQADLLGQIAKIIAKKQANKAVEILKERVRLANEESKLEQAFVRHIAARDILQWIPSRAEVARTLIDEAEDLACASPEVDLNRYKAEWLLPNLALSEDLNTVCEKVSTLPLVVQAQAWRYISHILPPESPDKLRLAEQALTILNPVERTPEIVSEEIKVIINLLPLVDKKRQNKLLERLTSAGDYLQSVTGGVQYTSTLGMAIKDVAKNHLDWAKQQLLESNWPDRVNAWHEVIKEMAKINDEDAFELLEKRFANYFSRSEVVRDIIEIIACKDTDRAESVFSQKKHLLRTDDEEQEAYLALAEGYLAQGNRQKAEQIFKKQVLIVNEESIAHQKNTLQVAILKRAGLFVTLEAAQTCLMHFTDCPHCGTRPKQEKAKEILACIAARKGKIDRVKTDDFHYNAHILAAYKLANHVSPEVAKEYLQERYIWPQQEEAKRIYAHIASVEAGQDPDKLSTLLEHFGDGKQKPHFCEYMMALPKALYVLIRNKKMATTELKAIVERVYSLIIDYPCRHENKSAGYDQKACQCRAQREELIASLIAIMAQLDSNRSEEMLKSLPSQPVKVYALKRLLCHNPSDDTLIDQIIDANRECFVDPWQRAYEHYDLAILLPSEKSDTIRRLIELAEPLLAKKPTAYNTNKSGIPWRVGPAEHELQIGKAQSLMKLISDVDQLSNAIEGIEALKIMTTCLQLNDKLKILSPLVEKAQTWSDKDKLTLLWRIRDIATTKSLRDVQAFMAFSIPILHSLAGEDAFWCLYHYIEWAYQKLIEVDQDTHPCGTIGMRI